MRRSTTALFLSTSATCAWLATTPCAAADPVAECIAANEQSLNLRDQSKLIEARGQLAQCAASTCPDAIQQACRGRIAEVNAAIPSIVFDVKDPAGRDLSDVKISVDGQPSGTVGVTAIQLDPGQHAFHFEAAGQPAVDKTLVLREGEREKHETVVIGEVDHGTAKPPAMNRKVLGIIVGGAGVVAMVTAGVLGLVASAQYHGAAGCGTTTCSGPDGINATNSARDLGNVATAVLVAGGVVTAVGVVLWITAPKADATGSSAAATAASWGVGVTPGGALVRASF